MRFVMKIVALFISLSLVTASFALSQWIHTGGPVGGGITALAKNGSTIFAGAWSGYIYRSTDEGNSWNKTSSFTGSHYKMIVDGNILYAATDGNGFYKSTNNGEQWTDIGTNLPNKYIVSLGVLGADIYVGTLNGLYHTSDNGISWSLVNTGATGFQFSSVVLGNSVIAAASGSELFVSTNMGASWALSNTGLSGNYVNTLNLVGDTIYAGTSSALFRSINNGGSWTKIGPTMLSISSVFVDNNVIYVGSIGDGVIRSTNNGTSFSKVNTGMVSNNIRAVTVTGGTLLAGDYIDGMYISKSMGDSWVTSNKGFKERSVKTMAITPDGKGGTEIFACASVGSSSTNLMRTLDNGTTWTSLDPPLPLRENPSISVTPNAISTTVLVGGENGYVAQTNDQGSSWKLVPIRSNGTITALTIRKSTMLAGFDWYGVYRSTNNGESWDTTSMAYQTYRSIYAFTSNDTAIFMCTREGVYRSMDDGKNWIKKNNGLPSFLAMQTMTMAIVQNTVVIGGPFVGVYRTTDLGESWALVTSGLPNGSTRSIVSSGNNLYAAISDKGIYRSTDFGKSWTAFNDSLTEINIFSIAVSENIIFAGGSKGLWRHPSTATSVSSLESIFSVPTKFSLEQNYPNPFNPSTTITYHVPYSSSVSVKIFDLLGREIATLINEQLGAGTYTTRWNAHGFSSGVYLMRMESDNFSETKRIVLMK